MGNTVLTTQDLATGYTAKRHPPKLVTAGISVNLRAGELVCLLGPNGAGKSTLMRTLAGMQHPLNGSLRLLDRPLEHFRPRELARQLSVVLTERINVGALSVFDLVGLGRYPYTDWSGRLTVEDKRIVRWALDWVGAILLANRPVIELSDGERQKVMIARALAQQPALMLLDEPTAFLDLPRRVHLMGILRKLVRDTGCAVLLSTHDLDLALRSADQLWLMPMGGPVQTGTPEDLVLNGAFQAAFHDEDIKFDPYSGSFKIQHQYRDQIALEGDGLAAIWTARALEREGFRIQNFKSDTLLRVKITNDGSCSLWTVSTPRGHFECYSVHEVINQLKAPSADS